jgi:hypothetical protein
MSKSLVPIVPHDRPAPPLSTWPNNRGAVVDTPLGVDVETLPREGPFIT